MMFVKTNSVTPMEIETEQGFSVTVFTQVTEITTPKHTHHDSDLSELAWVIPLVLAGVLIMFIIALLCFYGVRTTELYVMRWCFKKYGCCNPNGREEYTHLKTAYDPESYSLNDISHHRTSPKQ